MKINELDFFKENSIAYNPDVYKKKIFFFKKKTNLETNKINYKIQ